MDTSLPHMDQAISGSSASTRSRVASHFFALGATPHARSEDRCTEEGSEEVDHRSHFRGCFPQPGTRAVHADPIGPHAAF